MIKNNLVFTLALVLIYQNSNAKDLGLTTEVARTNYSEKIKPSADLSISMLDNVDLAVQYLKSKGVIADEKTEIQIHEEKNYIDLSCFNCIVVSIDARKKIENSVNKDLPTPY
ncbi:MAG: hypothetical protein ABL930_10475 [Pseudobdellovibrio sp.]